MPSNCVGMRIYFFSCWQKDLRFFVYKFFHKIKLTYFAKIIYRLATKDIQNVALEELDRKLTDDEINRIIDLIANNIPWYEAIADAIREEIHSYDDQLNDEISSVKI